MTKFIFKSNASDLQKISQSLETIQKNILYITFRTDFIIKELNKITVDKGLQKQVDEYFDDEETSPQTDQDNKQDLD